MKKIQSSLFDVREIPPALQVAFQAGLPNHCYHPEILTELLRLSDESGCDLIIFDFADVKCLVSGLLGMFASLKTAGVEVRIYRPSQLIRQTLDAVGVGSMIIADLPLGTEENSERSQNVAVSAI